MMRRILFAVSLALLGLAPLQPAQAREPYDSLEEIADALARVNRECPDRGDAAIAGSIAQIRTDFGDAAASRFEGIGPGVYPFLETLGNFVALDDSTERVRRITRSSIQGMLNGADPGGAFLETAELRFARDAQPVQWRVEDGVGVITVAEFYDGSARDIERAVRAIRRQSPRPLGYVIDVRGNAGGLLDQVMAAADVFLDGGTIGSMANAGGCVSLYPSGQAFGARRGDVAAAAPVVLLIDSGTQQGGEMFAAALVDNGRARAVGARSGGVGRLDVMIPLSSRSYIRMVSAQFVRPSGVPLEGQGLEPAFAVDATQGDDAMLAFALQLLHGP